jgi:ABC-type polysaccharide/polyol phosphate transport system ATPase subunit
VTTRALAPGEIAASGLGRLFEIRLVKNRSLKETILRRNISPKRQLWALRDVDLRIDQGESFGIVGQNGSGKSTLLKLIAGVYAPSTGSLAVGGRVGSLIELGAGFHPDFTGVENIYLNAAIHGISRSYVDEHLDEIVGFAELEDFADMAVKAYSSGMFMRLGFSVAMHINPDILLLDEALGVGDEAFQQKCFGKIWDFKRAGGTIVFVSHDPGAVERLCDRAILLKDGIVAHEGVASDVLRAYHRSLAERAPRDSAPGGTARATPSCRVHEVVALSADGERRDRVVEGEPLALEIWLYSSTGARGLNVTVRIRESSNREIGSQTATAVDLRPQRLEPLRLHLAESPLRDGRFFVDVSVSSHDGDAELALAERALELSVFSRDSGAAGPVRLGGSWELPAGAAETARELPTAERA